jgi:predicted NAD/FAD-dependent oxidoreductase
MVGAYEHFFNVLRKINTYHYLDFQKYLKVNFNKSGDTYSLSSGSLGKFSLLVSIFKNRQISFSEKIFFLDFVRKSQKLSRLSNIHQLSAFELLRSQKQSDNLIQLIWEPLILATMNINPENASAYIFLQILNLAFFADNLSSKLVFSSIPLMNLLTNLEKKVDNNFRIFYSQFINQIQNINDKFALSHGEKSVEEFDAVIFAIPPKNLLRILNQSNISIENKLIEFTEKVNYSPIISVYIWSENDFLNKDFEALINTNFHWIFREKSQSLRFTLTKSFAEEMISYSRKEIIEMIFNDLEKSYENFNRNSVLHYQIIFEKQATIAITPEIEILRPNQRVKKGIYISGDWTSTNLPATMESAAKSGQIAARFLLEDYI